MDSSNKVRDYVVKYDVITIDKTKLLVNKKKKKKYNSRPFDDRSYYVFRPQRINFPGAVSQRREYLVGVLAQQRRLSADLVAGALERHRGSDYFQFGVIRTLQLLHDTDVLDVFVVERLRNKTNIPNVHGETDTRIKYWNLILHPLFYTEQVTRNRNSRSDDRF